MNWETLSSWDDSGFEVLWHWSNVETQQQSEFRRAIPFWDYIFKFAEWMCIRNRTVVHALCLHRWVGHFPGVPFLHCKNRHVIPNAYFTENYNLVKNDLTVSLFIQMKKISRIKGVEKEILTMTCDWREGKETKEISTSSATLIYICI